MSGAAHDHLGTTRGFACCGESRYSPFHSVEAIVAIVMYYLVLTFWVPLTAADSIRTTLPAAFLRSSRCS